MKAIAQNDFKSILNRYEVKYDAYEQIAVLKDDVDVIAFINYAENKTFSEKEIWADDDTCFDLTEEQIAFMLDRINAETKNEREAIDAPDHLTTDYFYQYLNN